MDQPQPTPEAPHGIYFHSVGFCCGSDKQRKALRKRGLRPGVVYKIRNDMLDQLKKDKVLGPCILNLDVRRDIIRAYVGHVCQNYPSIVGQ